MNIQTFGSSSKGNCYLIDDGNTKLMIECGVDPKLLKAKGIRLSDIKGCLISHEHIDHSRFAKVISKQVGIYTSEGTYNGLKEKPSLVGKHLKAGEIFLLGSYKIIPFETKHDSAEPLGFYIHSIKTEENVLFAIDTYYLPNTFANMNYILIECNYSREILDRKIKNKDDLDLYLEKRRLESHFSLENVIDFLKANDLSKCKKIILLHLSDKLSDEKQFKARIQGEFGIPVEVATK